MGLQVSSGSRARCVGVGHMKDGKSGSNTLADKGAESAEDAGEMGLRAGLALGRAFLLYLAKKCNNGVVAG